jgi:hypothetical protein
MKSNVFSKAGIVILGFLALLWLSGCASRQAETVKPVNPSKAGAAGSVIGKSPAEPLSGPSPILPDGSQADWWFVFKFNAKDFPGCDEKPTECRFGGYPVAYESGQQYVYASNLNPTLQKGTGCLGNSYTDPVSATFSQVYYSSTAVYYVIWNDQFYNQPIINGCNNACFAPWAHSKGMVAWDDNGNGFVMQVSTPSWPASGSKANPRISDGNTLGCVYDDDVYLSQHFFALKINKDDLIQVLKALQNAAVVTDPTNPQIVKNGGPDDVQLLVDVLGRQPGNNETSGQATIVKLSKGVQLISKPSSLNVPPWQMVSALMGGVFLQVASWYGDPNPIPSTTTSTTITCWDSNLGTPGSVEIAKLGHWDKYEFSLQEDANHAKFGASDNLFHYYAIFGDLNQQGALTFPKSASEPYCYASQNGRGGTFYVVEDQTLQQEVYSLISPLPAKAKAP